MKRRFKVRATLLIAVVLAGLLVYVAAHNEQGEGAQHDVTLQVTGSAPRANISYVTPSGKRIATVSVPWSTSFKVAGGMALSLVAESSGSGAIDCVIREDGNTLLNTSGSGSGSSCSFDATS